MGHRTTTIAADSLAMRDRWLWTVLDDSEPMRRKANEKSDVFIVQHPSSYKTTESDGMRHA